MQTLVVIDYGSPVTQLVARAVRAAGVYSEILPCTADLSRIKALRPVAVILASGQAQAGATEAPKLEPGLLELGVPILGLGYGMHILALACGGSLNTNPEYTGRHEITLSSTSPLWAKIAERKNFYGRIESQTAVNSLPAGFKVTATASGCPIAAMENSERKLYGLQFQPEIPETECGAEIISAFLFDICGLKAEWNMQTFVENTIQRLRQELDGKKVVCAISGGVDSTVTAVLLHRAIGDNLHCIFVDNGLLRAGEVEQVNGMLKGNFRLNLECIDAQELFLSRLKGIDDPETKRKIIGHGFIEVFEEAAKKLGQVDYLAQGTVYPDIIESVSPTGNGVVIKSHHNVGGLPERMRLSLVEPLRNLFKDEVRAAGKVLELPDEFIWRHPFPGPGLAVRIVGEITPERLEIVRAADAIAMQELRAAGWYDKVWQGFAALLPVKSVGMRNDRRTYESTIALRMVNSVDAMTAEWVELPYALLRKISARILQEVSGVNRVVYDISDKPPATIEWE